MKTSLLVLFSCGALVVTGCLASQESTAVPAPDKTSAPQGSASSDRTDGATANAPDCGCDAGSFPELGDPMWNERASYALSVGTVPATGEACSSEATGVSYLFEGQSNRLRVRRCEQEVVVSREAQLSTEAENTLKAALSKSRVSPQGTCQNGKAHAELDISIDGLRARKYYDADGDCSAAARSYYVSGMDEVVAAFASVAP